MMKCFKKDKIDRSVISEIAESLKAGKLVVFPTDTVYGIGTNAYDKCACEKVYEVKGRPKQKPLIVLISNISMLKDMVNYISPVEQNLINSFWPGPLTIKFSKKDGIFPEIISAGDEYIRVRLVSEGFIHDIIQVAGVPIVAPSANLSESATGTKVENIVRELGDKVDYILDCGDIKNDFVSTIVQVIDEKVLVIREGAIKREDLMKAVPIINLN